jgi:hypothetical protein
MLIGSIIIFIASMSSISEVGLGDFIGEGQLELNLSNEKNSVPVYSNWGPSNGFYIYLLSILVIIINIFFPKIKNQWWNK